jgi:hypothetical protein
MKPSPGFRDARRSTAMSREIVFLTVLVLALPLSAVADGGVTSSVVNLITTLPEPSTLGLLGSGLIGFAVVIRRKLKVV